MIAWLALRERSSVGEARRRARRMANALHFTSVDVEHVAIVATEMTQNAIRHAGGGHFLVDTFGYPGAERLVLATVDEGPGITRLDTMLRDGRTSADSPGTGLGAMLRLSDRLDLETAPGTGTLISAEFRHREMRDLERPDVAGLRTLYPGARVCGDTIAMSKAGPNECYLVCDGLGHGTDAAIAAELAKATFLRVCEQSPIDVLGDIAIALQGTRGAVASVIRLDRQAMQLDYAGLGNITTLIVRDGTTKRLPVRDGLLGGRLASPHSETVALTPHDTIVMHSDGLTTIRGLARRSALLHRSAPLIAARLLASNTRGRDDASILVVRMKEGLTL